MIITVVGYKNTSINISETYTDLAYDNDPIMLGDTSFKFGFGLISGGVNYLEDETYFSMESLVYVWNDTVKQYKTTKVKIEKCTNNDFPTINSTQLDYLNISKYYCLQNKDLYVGGNNNGPNYAYIKLFIDMCYGTDSKGNECKDINNIYNVLIDSILSVKIVNTYFDGSDLLNPIKDFLDDRIEEYPIYSFTKRIWIYIKQNSVELRDSIYQFSADGDQKSFNSIETVQNVLSPGSSRLFHIGFYKDPKSSSFSRQVFSWLDCFGNIGGVNEVLKTAGGLLVGLFSGKIFLFSILSALYQVDATSTENLNKLDSSKKENNMQNILENLNEEEKIKEHAENLNINLKENRMITNKTLTRVIDNDLIINSFNKHNHDLDPNIVNKAAESMKLRYRYNYSVYDFSYNLLFPFKFFGRKCRKHKGEEKFAKEFDVVEFTRTQRKLKMLMHSLMDDSERFLAPNQKLNAISLISDSEGILSDDPSYAKVPKMLSRTKIKQKHASVVDKFFEKYLKEIHTEKDVYLLYGVTSEKELCNEKQSSYLIKNTQAITNDKTNDVVNMEESYDAVNIQESNNAVNMEESKEKLIDIYTKREFVPCPSFDIFDSVKNVVENNYDEDEEISIKENVRVNQKSSDIKNYNF